MKDQKSIEATQEANEAPAAQPDEASTPALSGKLGQLGPEWDMPPALHNGLIGLARGKHKVVFSGRTISFVPVENGIPVKLEGDNV